VSVADSRCVAQVPEPLSPRYRSRVREVSTSYRSHGVNHEPESHTGVAQVRRVARVANG
jgi:hypothetical protein